jgi:hypothetical protein
MERRAMMAKSEGAKASEKIPKLTNQHQFVPADASGTTTSAGPRGRDNLRRPERTYSKGKN